MPVLGSTPQRGSPPQGSTPEQGSSPQQGITTEQKCSPQQGSTPQGFTPHGSPLHQGSTPHQGFSPQQEAPPPLIRGDGLQHRKKGDPFVRECQQHETPRPTWDSKREPKEPSTTDGLKKVAASVGEFLNNCFSSDKKKVEEVLSSDERPE